MAKLFLGLSADPFVLIMRNCFRRIFPFEGDRFDGSVLHALQQHGFIEKFPAYLAAANNRGPAEVTFGPFCPA
jgi:hypothetical protein